MDVSVPKIVFIVPYRNRPQHKFFFSNYVSNILKNTNINYEIYFSHQCDARSFNRGAMKNIGFLAIKQKYPEHYKNITFVFNDVDTIPFDNILNYETKVGTVKHFYGFEYALGGIVSFKGVDFEATNGFPNFWGWGMEDNVLQKRCQKIGLKIDRSHFFPIGSPEILQLFDGVSRLINRKDPWRATNDNGVDGIRTIKKLELSIDTESKNPLDNINVIKSDKIYLINATTFMTGIRFEHDNYYQYDLREPKRKIVHPDRVATKKMVNTTDDWSKIPFYPTSVKRAEMEETYGKNDADKIIKYSYENSVDPNEPVIPPLHVPNQTNINQNPNAEQEQKYNKYLQYLQYLQQLNTNKGTINQTNINKYSPTYAKSIGHKSRAQSSVNIRLGGVY